jgi:tetratricopeptide (TPR) repeat protein
MGKNEWIFDLPRLTEEVRDRLEVGIDCMGEDPQRAASIFLELIEEFPEHMDAYHHLALTLEQWGKSEEAFQTWSLAVDTALKFFPARFSLEGDRLDWGILENRPFLRLYHAYGLQLLRRGQAEEGLQVFEHLLGLSPNDNLGARALAVGCYFELESPERVLSVCRQFPDDAMEHLLYGKVLAYFQMGELAEACQALEIARRSYPLIVPELLKTRHAKPKRMDERRVTMGGLDQAYFYWQDHGKYWKATPGAIDFLKRHGPGHAPGKD